MSRSLTVLLPVRNCQYSLKKYVAELLDVLPELTSRLELLLLDNGSRDETVDAAQSLAREFPQVRSLQVGAEADRADLLRYGLSHSIGEVVLVLDSDCRIPVSALMEMWKAVQAADLVIGRVSGRRPLLSVGLRVDMEEGSCGGFMIKRAIIDPVGESLCDSARLRLWAQRHHLYWRELAFAPRPEAIAMVGQESGGGAGGDAMNAEPMGEKPWPQQRDWRRDDGQSSTRPERHDYVGLFKDFALGE